MWIKENSSIRGSEELLHQILNKYKIRNGETIMNCFLVIYKLRNVERLENRAEHLWSEYFKHLWTVYSKDFGESLESEIRKSAAYVSISENVRWTLGEMNVEVAVRSIFDTSKITENSSVWSLPFLVAYKDQTRTTVTKTKMDLALKEAAIRLNLQYIHHAGDKERFFAGRGVHSYQKLELIPKEIINDFKNIQTTKKTQTIKESKEKRQKEKAVKFTDEEKIDLCRGLNTFGTVGNYYSDIAKCKDFGFWDGKFSGKIRNNANLKDLHTTMRNTNQLLLDRSSNIFFYINSSVEACRGVSNPHSPVTYMSTPSVSIFEKVTSKDLAITSNFLLNTPPLSNSNLSRSKLLYINSLSPKKSTPSKVKRNYEVNLISPKKEKLSKSVPDVITFISDDDVDLIDKKMTLDDKDFRELNDLNDDFFKDFLNEDQIECNTTTIVNLPYNNCYSFENSNSNSQDISNQRYKNN